MFQNVWCSALDVQNVQCFRMCQITLDVQFVFQNVSDSLCSVCVSECVITLECSVCVSECVRSAHS